MFDNFLEYKYKGKIGSTFFYLTNTKNDSYILNNYYGSDTMYGKIRDYNNNIFHELEILTTDTILKFKYLYSLKYSRNNYGSKFIVESFVNEIDSTSREIKIVVFKNKRKKKIECKIDLIVENSDDFFCNQILYSLSHGRLINKNFKIEKGTILNYKVEFPNGFKTEIKLIKKQKINTILSISKEQLKFY